MFSAELKKPALKFLKSIKDKTPLKRISDRIDKLEKNPFPQDIERVEGYQGFQSESWRLQNSLFCGLFFFKGLYRED